MSLLAKTNPTATCESVIWNAKLWGTVTVIAYSAICIWNTAWRELWWLKLPGAAAFGAAMGALMEWQLDDGVEIYWIVLEVEEEFGIEIAKADWIEIDTIGDLFQCVLKNKVSTYPESAGTNCETETWERLSALLVRQLALKPEQVVKTARFYNEIRL